MVNCLLNILTHDFYDNVTLLLIKVQYKVALYRRFITLWTTFLTLCRTYTNKLPVELNKLPCLRKLLFSYASMFYMTRMNTQGIVCKFVQKIAYPTQLQFVIEEVVR